MTLDGWEDLSDEKPKPPQLPLNTKPPVLRGPPPRYDSKPAGPPRLSIIGATWGGVVVTPDIQAMITASQTLTFDMKTMAMILQPDPAFGVVKMLTVLYQYEGQDTPWLLNVSEENRFPINVTETAHQIGTNHIQAVGYPWKEEEAGVEILAVTYGPQRIYTPSVLQELTKFLEGQRGQIRMTNAFFKVDTWHNRKKSWTVFFRFTGSHRVQCVCGLEDGALELPWTRS